MQLSRDEALAIVDQYGEQVDRLSDKAILEARRALAAAKRMPPEARAAYMRRTITDISRVYGDLAAEVAGAYVQQRLAYDPDLDGADLRPRPDDKAYLAEQVEFALQLKTGGLVDEARDSTVSSLLALHVQRHVYRRAYRHINDLAGRLGKKTAVVPEPGACGFCDGRSKHHALPPYHRSCRCRVELVDV